MAGKRGECVRWLPSARTELQCSAGCICPEETCIQHKAYLYPDNIKLLCSLGVLFILVYQRSSYVALVGLKLTGILLPLPPQG